jgi:hypothetical protein
LAVVLRNSMPTSRAFAFDEVQTGLLPLNQHAG